MIFEKAHLENGLRVITTPLPNMESATVTIWVNTGSRYESPKVAGISHFLEHMVAKGTTKRPTAKIIAETIDAFGGEFNAGTTKDWTNFYIKTRKAKLSLAFDLISDMVLDPLLKDEDIEREKGVIVEEIGMYEDTPMMHIDDVFERLIFKGHNLGCDIIGTRKSVKDMTRNDFLRYRKAYYCSDNILVTVSGGVDAKTVNKLAQKHLSSLPKLHPSVYKKFVPTQKKPRVLLEDKKAEQAHFMLGFLGRKRGEKDRFAEAVLTTILGGGMSSRLFSEVREKRGLAYSIRTSSDHYDDTGYVETYAGVDPKRIDEALKVILDQTYGLSSGEYKITSTEINKAKEYLKGHIALSLEDTKVINHFFGIRELKLGKLETPQDVYEGIDKVSYDEILAVAQSIFNPEKLNLAIIGPYKDDSKFKKIITGK
ncbi:insulinase family protein [Candidatus Woesebacteria bacterium]|nr:MAG: insulinase family protein [Candidatus Woesebacteria bacterium]